MIDRDNPAMMPGQEPYSDVDLEEMYRLFFDAADGDPGEDMENEAIQGRQENDMKNNEARKYKHIRAWGEHLGSFPYYIKDEQGKALSDGAPITAIYRNANGRWVTAEEIKNEQLRKLINDMVMEMKG